MGGIKSIKKLKPFHWSKLNKQQSDLTIFKGIDKKINTFKIKYNELDKLFENIIIKKDDKKDKKKEEKLINNTSLIDPKRAQNVEIGLKRIDLSHDNILDAILSLNDKLLPPDKVKKLIPYVPSDNELEQVRTYVKDGNNIGNLTQVEQFFVKLMDLSQIKERLKLWLFKSEFPNIIRNVDARINMINEIINKLSKNNKLKKILYVILCIGNYMNSNSIRGNAFGFYMEPTLDLLNNMKSNDGTYNNGNGNDKVSLMYFVVKTIIEDVDSDLVKWVTELNDLPLASKVQTNGMIQDIDAIKRDMKSIKNKINQQRSMFLLFIIVYLISMYITASFLFIILLQQSNFPLFSSSLILLIKLKYPFHTTLFNPSFHKNHLITMIILFNTFKTINNHFKLCLILFHYHSFHDIY